MCTWKSPTSLSGKEVELVTPGEANMFRLEMDYPFYSGTVTYSADFDLDKNYAALVLNLHDVRDSAAVYVNDKLAGKRLWAPHTLDIAEFAQPGKNTLEIQVRNNLTNLILGNPRSLGLLHAPTLAGMGDKKLEVGS